MLPVHVKEIRKQPDFDVTSLPRKSPSELEEDLDHLLETTRLGATVDWGAPVFDTHPDSTTSYDNSESASDIPPIMIKNYLKDLMAIPHPRIDNSDLLDGVDHVSRGIID